MQSHYTRLAMAEALEQVGLKRGDAVFSHSNVGYFGYPEGGVSRDNVFQTILGAFFDVIGSEGTVVVPTFTYSFCRRDPFDPDNTPSEMGIFSEMLRAHHQARRSHDPIFSVAALGPRAEDLTSDVSAECFGKDSFWDRFLQMGGIVCNMNFDAGSTFIHYVERCLNVPYRYDKLFPGTFIINGREKRGAAIYFCLDLSNSDTIATFEPFHEAAVRTGVARTSAVGRGQFVAIRASGVYGLIEDELSTNPWLLTPAGKRDAAPVLIQPAQQGRSKIHLEKDASMREILQALWPLKRDLVSEDYDAALETLSEQIPLTIHEYPTGSHCWTWIIPEKWTCREAYVETVDGQRILSYEDNPLHVLSYSLPYNGTVARDTLLRHLYVHPKIPEATPAAYRHYHRDWGLCCSRTFKESLTEDEYRVVIDSFFSFGTLKVGEMVLPGETEQCVVLCAHLASPCQANYGLSGVVVGLRVMRELSRRERLRYAYRFLIVPRTLGSVAYLSHNQEVVSRMKGGISLDMLGLKNPHALGLSLSGDTEMDRCLVAALEEGDPEAWTAPFRTTTFSDELNFNAPGVRVPMLSLSRALPAHDPDRPYKEHLSGLDTPDLVCDERLDQSVCLVLRMVDTLERNLVPMSTFKGQIFCARYGIDFDRDDEREDYQRVSGIMFLIDGKRSVVDIARDSGLSFSTTKATLDEFHRLGLIHWTTGNDMQTC